MDLESIIMPGNIFKGDARGKREDNQSVNDVIRTEGFRILW